MKTIDKFETANAILRKINSTAFIPLDLEKFNEMKDDEEFLKEAAKFVGVPVVYQTEPKTLRLLLFDDCDRACEGCCNKQWDLSKLPQENDFSTYEEIILTGGEPLLKSHVIIETVKKIREQNKYARIILYTAKTDNLEIFEEILKHVDSITVTLHEQKDIAPFIALNHHIRYILHETRVFRLNIFKEVNLSEYLAEELYQIMLPNWVIKDNIEWIEECPLPEHEVFKRL